MVSVEVFISTKLRSARHDARHAVGIKTAQALLEVKVAIQERAPALHLQRILERRGEASLLGERQVPVDHRRLRRFQSCAFHLIVVAVQHLPVCIHKVHLAVAGGKLVP